MLELKDITVAVGERRLFAVKSLVLQKGMIALVGRNGSGKSTFIRTILGEHADFSGTVLVDGKNPESLSALQKSRLVSVVYSRPRIFGNHTVLDVLALGRLPYQNLFSKISAADLHVIDQMAGLLKIKDWYAKSFNVLSDGEKQLVMIGRALVQDTPLLLMDEPAAFLDVVNRFELSVLLKKIADETGKLIICSTHQLDRVEKDCDGVLLLADEELKLLTDSSNFLKTINASFGIS
ncbi:MAG: ABC transporter ATP-binding protein [Bacteroidetes bacterium]|nr:ABC transporter ATP-binding protein [Bacteroidota bacterium]